jgi:hypothetical protein
MARWAGLYQTMNKKAQPFVENISEATVACLVTMVQGNVLALGLSHWIIATQTGVVAGTITSVAILAARARDPRTIAVALGLVTAVVDYFMHPSMIAGPAFLEALLTGIGAAVLSYLVTMTVRRLRKTRG